VELKKMISEENKIIELTNKQKEKLKSINLIEGEVEDDIYNWKTLFNKSRPVSVYTEAKRELVQNALKQIEDINNNRESVLFEEAKENITICNNNKQPKKVNKKNDFVFPIILIDEKEENIKEYITIPKNISMKRKKMEEANKSKVNFSKSTLTLNKASLNKGSIDNLTLNKSNTHLISSNEHPNTNSSLTIKKLSKNKFYQQNQPKNAIRPQSVYTKRNENDVFYMSKDFSEYFTMDFKEFSEKFSLLHPKIKCDKKKLKKILDYIKEAEKINKEANENQNDNSDIIIEQKLLNLAGNSKNIMPLLKSIYRQTYPPDMHDVLKLVNEKNYYKSNKPLGNSQEDINFKFNIRGGKMNEIKPLHLINSQQQTHDNEELNIETYDKNDPDIKIFNENNLDNLEINNINNEILSENGFITERYTSEEHTDNLTNYKEENMNLFVNDTNKSITINKETINIKTNRPKTASFNKINNQNNNKKRINSSYKSSFNHTQRNAKNILIQNNSESIFNNEAINNNMRDIGSMNDQEKKEKLVNVHINSVVPNLPFNMHNNKVRHNKEKSHPFSYRNMNNAIKNSGNMANKVFDNLLKIENVNEQIKKEFTNIDDLTLRSNTRPKTSKAFNRPVIRPESRLENKIKSKNIIFILLINK
jgi:hypothetical protein